MTIDNLVNASCLLILLGMFLLPFLIWNRKATARRDARRDHWVSDGSLEDDAPLYFDSLKPRPPGAPDVDPNFNWRHDI
ncbi:hypothetical protein [Rhodanobacter sp. FW106-PBR-LB-2-11]|uniref:hypothetical protein n=1 Tax=Rhodanobacter sp. FW106-PBR-LB-2-11 TaxID=1524463 RepID=UPI0034E51DF1